MSEEYEFRDEDWPLVTLQYCSEKPGLKCFVAGEFCGWEQSEWLPMNEKENGVHSITIRLLEGCYQYKFVVNGSWESDPSNPVREQTFGNSILFVGDFDRRASSGVVNSLSKHCPVPHREYRRPGAEYAIDSCDAFQVILQEELKIPDNLACRGVLPRPVFVYLPPGYHDNQATTFPVVYSLDGQNVFSTPGDNNAPKYGGWWLDSQLDLLVADKATQPFIIVAVPNGDAVSEYPLRKREYCPHSYTSAEKEPFARYLVDVVKRAVDQRFRTKPEAEHSVLLGASLGGLYVFTLLLCAPEVFGKAISMSPSFWFFDCNNMSIYDLVRQKFLVEKDFQHRRQLYIHVADGTGDNMYETKEMGRLLREIGGEFMEGRDFCFDFDDGRRNECEGGNTHSEAVWRHRLHFALRFLLPPI